MQGKIIIATQLVQSNQVSPYTCALCSIMLWATYKCIVWCEVLYHSHATYHEAKCRHQTLNQPDVLFYYANFYAMQVDMSKVKLDVLKPWITQKITEILKMEDDVVIDYVNNQLEEKVITQSIFLFLFHIADM